MIPAYVDRLCEDLTDKSGECTGFCVDTVYLGGGTPSLLSGEETERIIKTVRDNYNLSDDAEITVEVNPSSLTREKAEKYAKIGITRVSIGMQSACDGELTLLGRLHSLGEFDTAYDLLRNAGIENISIDLMYGLPGQTTENLKRTLSYIFEKAPEHVSAYCLKVEEGTPFHKKCVCEADEDTAYEQYAYICDTLARHGYHRYEVSNFAKNGLKSRHNCKYWRCEQYLGFGPGAHSFFNGYRYGYDKSLVGYIDGGAKVVDSEEITPVETERERIIFGLRLSEGVRVEFLDENTLASLVGAGLMDTDGVRGWLTTAGYFVSNAIISEFID